MTDNQLKGFANFWNAYPRKQKRIDAQKAWVQMAKERPSTAEIVHAVNCQKKSTEWKKDKGQYIPHPATWLRGGCWDDALSYEVKVKVRCYVCQSERILGEWMGKPYCTNPECKKEIRGY